jgi:hypothetical protein
MAGRKVVLLQSEVDAPKHEPSVSRTDSHEPRSGDTGGDRRNAKLRSC